MKTNILCRALLILLVFIIGFGFAVPRTEASTEIGAFVSSDLHLIKDNSPYVVTGDTGLHFDSGHTLTIDPGVTLLLSSGWLYIEQANLIIGNASSKEKVVIDKKPGSNNWSGIYLNTSKAVIDSLEIKNADTPIYSWYGDLSLKNSSIDGTMQGFMSTGIYAMEGNLNIASTTLYNFQNKAIYANNTKGTINKSIISENGTGIFYDGEASANFSGTENKFVGNNKNIYNANNATTLDFRGNDWGTGGAPVQGSVVGKVLTGFEEAVPCCSSVVFIPGLMATRLYRNETILGLPAINQLWEPNTNADVEKLYLDENGKSIESDIYIDESGSDKGVIDEALGFNVYKNFLDSMNSFIVDPDSKVRDFGVLPYDWRKDIYDVVDDKMIENVIKLAEDSNNKKVTIVAHSNGGLIGKILIDRLREQGKDNIIENFIMVAVPQMGTPASIASILHGDEQEIPKKLGWVLNKSTARKLGENMKSAYTLLPSKKYFDSLRDPVITFDSSISSLYNASTNGGIIDTFSELKDFLTDNESQRTKPQFKDTATPNILRSSFIEQADFQHDILDSWSAPEGIKVVQIAGWGLDTLNRIEYSAKTKLLCIGGVACLEWERKPAMTEDGDSTVVAPSAVIQDVDTYYLNLQDYNSDLFGGRRNRKHSDILEAEPLQQLIKNIVKNDTSTLPSHMSTSMPAAKSVTKKLHFDVHSPVSIGITDDRGNYTGIINSPSSPFAQIREEIPNSYYMEFGEGKYTGVTGDGNYQVMLKGTGSGTFTFNMSESVDGEETEVNFVDIPVATSSVVLVTNSSDIVNASLKIDMTGDGIYEKEIKPGVYKDPVQLLQSLKQRIVSLNMKPKWEKEIISKIDKIIKSLQKDRKLKAALKIDKYIEWIDLRLKKIESNKNTKKAPEPADLQYIKDQLTSIELL